MYKFLVRNIFMVRQLDEYRQRKIDHLGSYLFMINTWLWILTITIMSISLGMGYDSNHTLMGLLFFFILTGYFELVYVYHVIKKEKLSVIDVDKNTIKQAKRDTLINIFINSFITFIIAIVLTSINHGDTFLNALVSTVTDPIMLVKDLIIGIMFGLVIGWIEFKNIKKFK